jgi:hypothetical protein
MSVLAKLICQQSVAHTPRGSIYESVSGIHVHP